MKHYSFQPTKSYHITIVNKYIRPLYLETSFIHPCLLQKQKLLKFAQYVWNIGANKQTNNKLVMFTSKITAKLILFDPLWSVLSVDFTGTQQDETLLAGHPWTPGGPGLQSTGEAGVLQ